MIIYVCVQDQFQIVLVTILILLRLSKGQGIHTVFLMHTHHLPSYTLSHTIYYTLGGVWSYLLDCLSKLKFHNGENEKSSNGNALREKQSLQFDPNIILVSFLSVLLDYMYS